MPRKIKFKPIIGKEHIFAEFGNFLFQEYTLNSKILLVIRSNDEIAYEMFEKLRNVLSIKYGEEITVISLPYGTTFEFYEE